MRHLLVLLLVMAGCARAPLAAPNTPRPDPPTPSAPPPAAVDTLVLGGPDSIVGVSRVPSGEILVRTPNALLRFANEEAKEAIVIPLPEPAKESVTAASADVTAVLAESGELYVARAATVEKMAHVTRGSRLKVSDDGRVIAVDQRDAAGAPKTGIYDLRTQRVRFVDIADVMLDPRGRFVAMTGMLLGVDDAGLRLPLAGQPFGFFGDNAVFADPASGNVSLVDGNGVKRVIKTCRNGGAELDRVTGRVVQVCGRELVIIDGATGRRTALTLPVSEVADLVGFSPVAARDRIRLDFSVSQSSRSWSLDVDPTTGRFTASPPSDEDPTRNWIETAPEVSAPVGSIKATMGRAHVDEDGVQLPWCRFGSEEPGARPSMLGIAPQQRGGCPAAGEHASLTTGELWFEATDKSAPQACICNAAICKPSATPSVLGGGGDSLVTSNRKDKTSTQIHVTDLDGHDRGITTWEGACTAGVTRADRRVASVRCRHSENEPESLLELDLATGKHLRTTPLAFPNKNVHILALGDASVFVESSVGSDGAYVVELEAGTGKRLVTIYPSVAGGIARFPDGKVEFKSSESTDLEPQVLCVEGHVARPFATCRDRMRVEDRYRVHH